MDKNTGSTARPNYSPSCRIDQMPTTHQPKHGRPRFLSNAYKRFIGGMLPASANFVSNNFFILASIYAALQLSKIDQIRQSIRVPSTPEEAMVLLGTLFLSLWLCIASFLVATRRPLRGPHAGQGPAQSVKAPVTSLLLALASTACIGITAACIPPFARLLGVFSIVWISLIGWGALLNTLYGTIRASYRLPSILGVAGVLVIFHFIGYTALTTVPNLEQEDIQRTKEITGRDFDNYFLSWLVDKEALNSSDGKYIPVFLIAAEGGGLRAAYWTARSLGEIDAGLGGNLRINTLAYSGVSGGSLGIAAFLDSSQSSESPAAVFNKFFRLDQISPVVARLFFLAPFKELFGSSISAPTRDVSFEKTIADDWLRITGSSSFSESFTSFSDRKGTSGPIVILNAASVETGSPIYFTNLMSIGGDKSNFFFSIFESDVMREIRAPDLSLISTIHLSARFPFVSPPARLPIYVFHRNVHSDFDAAFDPLEDWRTQVGPRKHYQLEGCSPPLYLNSECGSWKLEGWRTVVDGGFYDNSGLPLIHHMVERIRDLRERAIKGKLERQSPLVVDKLKRIRMIALSITSDTGYMQVLPNLNEPALDAGIESSLAPLSALMSSREIRSRNSRDEINRYFSTMRENQIEANDYTVPDGYRVIRLSQVLWQSLGDLPACTGRTVGEGPLPPLGWALTAQAAHSIDCAANYIPFVFKEFFTDDFRGKRYRELAQPTEQPK